MVDRELLSELTVYVLSVKTFASRIESVNRQLLPLGIPFQFVFRYDVEDFQKEPLPVHFDQASILTLPERSIVAKHVEAWRLALDSGKPYVLVLEDDAILHSDFVSNLRLILSQAKSLKPGFLINLGGANSRVPLALYREKQFFYPFPMETSEGYISDRLSIERRLDWLQRNRVDRSADHMTRNIDALTNTIHLWPKHAIVEQGSLFGRFDSSLDQGRASRLKPFLKFSYESKKFRRRTLKYWIANVL